MAFWQASLQQFKKDYGYLDVQGKFASLGQTTLCIWTKTNDSTVTIHIYADELFFQSTVTGLKLAVEKLLAHYDKNAVPLKNYFGVHLKIHYDKKKLLKKRYIQKVLE